MRVIYLSYDGIGEPVGYSQVLGYLRHLARTHQITLISFEKSAPDDALTHELEQLGIDWRPLSYHRRPPVLSTALDVIRGRRACVAASRDGRPAVTHVRSYVPALMALMVPHSLRGALLFDIRGFWADERVEGGIWRRGLLYRIAKWCERWFFREADAVVTLTEASVPQIMTWLDARDIPVKVIPTCVELTRFSNRPQRSDGPHLVWSGSIGTWYRFDLVSAVARALSLPLTVMTREVELARACLAPHSAEIYSVSPAEMPAQLYAGDIGLCLIRQSFSKTASAPTRFGEYLAAGMPVLTTAVGDLPSVVSDYRVGVVLEGEDGPAIERAVSELSALLADAELPARCQRAAREHFDVEAGAASYARLYASLVHRGGSLQKA